MPFLQKVSRAVLSSLINFSIDPAFLQQMVVNNVVSRLIDGILDKENKIVELYTILLSNVSRDERGARKVVQVGDALQGYYVSKLLDLFLESQKVSGNQRDDYSWVASILENITQIQEARDLLMEKSRGMFTKLLPFIVHPNLVRRRGVLGVIKNCLFESRFHSWVLGPDIDILPKLLLPLRGPEKYETDDLEGMPVELQHVPEDKSRDPDLETRARIVDCLLLLLSNKASREDMRKKQVYLIIRDYDLVEENEILKENLLNIINLLKGLDEGPREVNFNPLNSIDSKGSTKTVEELWKTTVPKPKVEKTQTSHPEIPHQSDPNPSHHQDLDEEGEEVEVL
eukprot:TRINITY_DN5684_c0_g2_i3.p1 TRINITY_DN5684_c0_g2~~TRINITY_DN5684_c0_g2_i3.p1  ORF type:complete len:341 (+),score=78.96 TRINITY_DN5684_c0_g2_i3:278-1300(+)